MEDESVNLFRKYILEGEYSLLFDKEIVNVDQNQFIKASDKQKNNGITKLLSIFDKVTQEISTSRKQEMMYYIYEQQYTELMASGKNIQAISLL